MSPKDQSSDEDLLRRAEEALTQIKVSQGLSEQHAAVLAALRIRLKGAVDKSLDEMLTAADDAGGRSLDELFEDEKPKGSLDDLLSRRPKRPTWPGES
jgi:hypothetical protein